MIEPGITKDTVEIRQFAHQDADQITLLLEPLWSHDPTMLAIYQWMHRDWQADSLIRHTLVAVVANTVIGVGTLFESTFHPCMLMLTINVAGAWQRRGIGSRLFTALATFGDGRPWFAKATRRDQAGMNFLTKHTFRPLVGTLTGILDPRDPQVRAWLQTLPTHVPGYHLSELAAVSSTTSLADIAQVHAARYRETHTWNPPIVESVETAIAHYCGPDVLADSHLCVFAGDQLVGAVNLIRNPFQPSTDEAYLVHLSLVGLPPDATNLLTGVLIRRAVEFARERGLRVRFEADDTHQPYQSWLVHAPAAEVDHDFVIMAHGTIPGS